MEIGNGRVDLSSLLDNNIALPIWIGEGYI